MAYRYPRQLELTPVYRGDAWSGVAIGFNKDGFDFTGTTASVKLRTSPDGPLLATLTPSTDVPLLGRFVVVFSADGVLTATLPIGAIHGDVELVRTSSPAFGPRSWFRFRFEVIGDITHA